jgi:putative aldouronate transport system substrate-binding protein
MKKFTRLIAAALSALMVSSSLFGCSAKNSSSSTSSAPLTTIKVAYIIFSSVPKDQQKVEDAINKITEKKINVKVKLVPINSSAYSQQINLMLSSNESLDLFADGTITAFFDYTSHATKGQLYDISSLLDKYGSGIKSAVGDYLSAAKVGGKLYGVPTVRDFAADTRIMMRKDLVDKYNIDYKNIKTTDDIEKVLATIKKNEPTITPLLAGANGTSTLFDSIGFSQNGDQLGDLIGVLLDNQVLKVTDYYESENAKETAALARKWYNAGYLLKDASTSQSSGAALVKAGKLFAYLENGKPGIELQDSSSAGTTLVSAEIGPALSDTQKVDGFMWSIPSYTTNSEAAMKFLNLMYSDSQVVNLLDWGIEGTHYTKVSGEDNTIDYPTGVTSSTTGYSLSLGFEFGNQFLSYQWKGDTENLWDEMKTFNDGASKSKALGFMFDATSVKTEYANVLNVINQYKVAIGTGAVDPSQLTEFISKLKTAGIDKVVQAKQTQLDAWAKTNS